MLNIKITDSDGKKPSFRQWDVDRILYISGVDSQPFLHFANNFLKRAIVVESEQDGTRWKCRVPNFILQFFGPFVVSVFCEGDESRTVLTATFQILPKLKPQDYTYEENIGYVNWVQKSQEAQDLLDAIQAKLDSGELKGDKGDTGPRGPSGIPGGSFDGNTAQILMRLFDTMDLTTSAQTMWMRYLRAHLTPHGYATAIADVDSDGTIDMNYLLNLEDTEDLRQHMTVTVSFADGEMLEVRDYFIDVQFQDDYHAIISVSYGEFTEPYYVAQPAFTNNQEV